LDSDIISIGPRDMLRKIIINTKSVEASAFVLSKMYFSQHMNSGKCFALSDLN
jgi:hypothetical protein